MYSEADESKGSDFLRTRSFGTFKHEFQLQDPIDYVRDGLGVSILLGIVVCAHCVPTLYPLLLNLGSNLWLLLIDRDC